MLRVRVHKCTGRFPPENARGERRPVAHLGTERGTSPPCPAGRWFCPEPSASSPTTPARLWSTGPLPGSPASSCGCAARLGSLRHNQRSHGKGKTKTTAKEQTHSNSRRPKLPCCTRGKRDKTNKNTHRWPTKGVLCFGFLFCGIKELRFKSMCLSVLPKEWLRGAFWQKIKATVPTSTPKIRPYGECVTKLTNTVAKTKEKKSDKRNKASACVSKKKKATRNMQTEGSDHNTTHDHAKQLWARECSGSLCCSYLLLKRNIDC